MCNQQDSESGSRFVDTALGDSYSVQLSYYYAK